jgi:aryl-alcohol dehydrogenase-like predicted oxidoreductase
MASKLPTRRVGQTEVSALGYGAMGISSYYGSTAPDEERFKVMSVSLTHVEHPSRETFSTLPQLLDAVYDAGCTVWDTADVYGDSEELIGRW